MDLYAKAAELGLQVDFLDAQGQPHKVSKEAIQRVLETLPQTSPLRLLHGTPVARSGDASTARFQDSTKLPVRWSIWAGGCEIHSGQSGEMQLLLPADLPSGVHSLQLADASGRAEQVPLVVAPPKCFGGNFDRTWLIAVQLYGVRSSRNWGIGDFTDLQNLIQFAADVGADGIGLNPLHALFDDRPGDCSPYSPNSRLFLNPLYIDVSALPGVALTPEDSTLLDRLRGETLVDYAVVADLKSRVLREAFAAHRSDKNSDFEAFQAERGPMLRRFAAFEALRATRKTPWSTWADFQKPTEQDIVKLSGGSDGEQIAFVEFVQWIADRQLKACADLAKRLEMRVGLYLDIAVGVQSDGFDAWDEQTAISRHLGVGAPPDPLNTAGQSWGLAGYNAAGLEARAFAPFRDMLQASMRHAGAVRLDHVLGLKRLYLVPHGFPPDQGVYVQMPFEALLAVTALESVANQCVVIGEDLGTVPDGFRDALGHWGLWSYRVMMFEQDYHSRAFFAAEQYPANALVTFNTHDLATFAGWYSLADLTLKRSIGLDPGESNEARHHSIAMLHDVLRASHIDGDGFSAVLTFLARTPSRLLAISLEDLLGVVEQANIPGTVNEAPNWRRRLPAMLEEFGKVIDIDALRRVTAERSTDDSLVKSN